MKDWMERNSGKPPLFGCGMFAVRVLAIAALAVAIPGASCAQDLPPSDEVPFIENYPIPEAGPGDLVLPDEDLPVSDAEARRIGDAVQTEQQRVYSRVTRLQVALKSHLDRVIPELGRKRIQEIQSALQLPENSGERKYRLRKLNAKAFMELPGWNTEAGAQTIGEFLFLERVDKGGNWVDEFRVVIPGLGFAEPKIVSGKLYPRMVDELTGSSHFFLQSELELDTPEWKRYIARVRAWSNRGRGRPEIFWVEHHPEIVGSPESGTVRIRYFGKPVGVRNRLTNWWRAVWVKPDVQSVEQMGLKVILDVGTAEALSYVLSGSLQDHSFAALNAAYSVFFGLFGSTVRNALAPVDPTNTLERLYKMGLRIVISSYSFGVFSKMISHGDASVVSFFTPSGRAMNLQILQNAIASNFAKDFVATANDVREATGHARYKISKIAGVTLPAPLKGTQFERNIFYTVPNLLKNADLLTLGTERNTLPHFLHYSMIVSAPILAWKHAQAIRYEHADDLLAGRAFRLLENSTEAVGWMLHDPKLYVPLVAKVLGSYVSEAFVSCKNFLLRADSTKQNETKDNPFEVIQDGEWVEVRLRKPEPPAR
jgi:hypothetical protein